MKFPSAKSLLWASIFKPKRSPPEQEKIEFLNKMPFFEKLSGRQLTKVSNIIYERNYAANEYVFEIEQPGAALFLIQEGEVVIEIPFENGHRGQLAVIKSGSFLGELALLDDSPRSATARATHPTKALALFRDDLLNLIVTDPEIASHIYRSLATVVGERLKKTNDLLSELQNAEHNEAA